MGLKVPILRIYVNDGRWDEMSNRPLCAKKMGRFGWRGLSQS